jgi:hypothetical protein
MSGSKFDNAKGAAEAGRRMLDQAIDAGIQRAKGPPAKPTLKRYSWSRLHTDLLDDVRWSLVARRANAPLPIVEAMLIRLENHANRSRPRGFVGDFSADGMAARWNVDEDMIGRIYAALEAPDVGWIDQDQIVTFWERNPDVVDETAAERMRRMRARRKQAKEEAAAARAGCPQPQAVTRNTVTVTTRADLIINQEEGKKAKRGSPRNEVAAGAVPINSGNIGDIEDPELWLAGEGRRLVCERMNIPTPLADTHIERWRRDMPDGSGGAFASILLAAAAAVPLNRPSHFHVLVTQQLERHIQEQRDGRQLGLMPPRPGGPKPASEGDERYGVTASPVDIQKRSAS